MLIGIVGSGIMGSGITEVAAVGGHEVILRSRSMASADATVANTAKSLRRQVDKGRMEAAHADAALARISCTSELGALSECDIVIESVVEDLDVKLDLFAELDDLCQPATILATNTSTLPVVDMAMATSRPDRVCGVHFFNPAPVMSLVEIVRPLTASDETMATVSEFASSCGKDVVAVKDEAGFIVNALLFPYLNSAVLMLERGTADAEGIDTAMKGGCGFPMGPLALLDLIGIDTTLSILTALKEEFGDPWLTPAPTLKRMHSAGHLGRKSGIGFYPYG